MNTLNKMKKEFKRLKDARSARKEIRMRMAEPPYFNELKHIHETLTKGGLSSEDAANALVEIIK